MDTGQADEPFGRGVAIDADAQHWREDRGDGRRGGKQIGRDAFKDTLRAMAVDATAHGFRSTFADWAADCTAYAQEVREQALAHAIPNKVEAAYRRGDLFDKRRKLMDAWATYCARVETDAGKVVALARA